MVASSAGACCEAVLKHALINASRTFTALGAEAASGADAWLAADADAGLDALPWLVNWSQAPRVAAQAASRAKRAIFISELSC